MDVPQFIAGRFRIEGEIGTGGMGTVYRAVHLGLQRPVAVKIIKPEFAADRDVADRFLREARTMAKLRHPHAAMIFDAGNLPDGRHFIILEYVDGLTLSEALSREGSFTPERAVEIAIQICDVLEEAHELGIIHRDLKPSNIMLNERGVRVLDFGVAKVLASSTEVTATHASTGSGQIVGTPRYMSPEQCLGQRVGARSDLYSLGVLLYEMLAGRPPFVDALPSAILVKQATAAPPPLFQVAKHVPRPLAIAVHTLLAKRAEDRPRTAAEVRTLLAKSLTKRQREVPETEPLSSTVAAVGNSTSAILRAAAPLGIVLAFGAMLLVWANRGETAGEAGTQLTDAATASLATSTTAAKSDAKKIAAEVANERNKPNSSEELPHSPTPASLSGAANAQVVRTKSGTTMVAIEQEKKSTGASFLALEKRGSAFKVAARGALDTADFRRANWTTERVDLDRDGFQEVLFVGANSQSSKGYRLVLYVPKTKETFALRVEPTQKRKPMRVMWSENLSREGKSVYREGLRRKVNEISGR